MSPSHSPMAKLPLVIFDDAPGAYELILELLTSDATLGARLELIGCRNTGTKQAYPAICSDYVATMRDDDLIVILDSQLDGDDRGQSSVVILEAVLAQVRRGRIGILNAAQRGDGDARDAQVRALALHADRTQRLECGGIDRDPTRMSTVTQRLRDLLGWIDNPELTAIRAALHATQEDIRTSHWGHSEAGNGLFPAGIPLHNPVGWDSPIGKDVFSRTAARLHAAVAKVTCAGSTTTTALRPCERLSECWAIWALKALDHGTLHRGLLIAAVRSPVTACADVVPRGEPAVRLRWPIKVQPPAGAQVSLNDAAATILALRELTRAGWTYAGMDRSQPSAVGNRGEFEIDLEMAVQNPPGIADLQAAVDGRPVRGARGRTTGPFDRIPHARKPVPARSRPHATAGRLGVSVAFSEADYAG